MKELLNHLKYTYEKCASTESDKEKIVLEIFKSDLQMLIESVAKQCEGEKQNVEVKYINLQDEYERLYYKYKGYRQAVTDILGNNASDKPQEK